MDEKVLARILLRRRRRRSARRRRFRALRCLLLLQLCSLPAAQGFDRKRCRVALGMQSGAIPDAQLSASSAYVSTVGAPHGRLHQERAGGGWCPKPQIEAGSREYIEVDLRDVHVLTEVATQGRHDKGRGQEYMEEYSIEYYRPKLGRWREYKSWDGKKLFSGNSDTTTVVRHRLEPAILASKVRVLPYSVHRRTVCTRLELYGCPDRSGLLSYTVPPSVEVTGDLSDSTYDGTMLSDGTLVDGLGRLADGQVGADSFTLDVGHGKGTGWVAWKNSTFPRKCIDLLFEFSSVRNFTEISIYTNNYFSKQAQVFGRVVIFFHVEGMLYVSEPVIFHPRAELNSEKAKNVTIKIPEGGIAKHVKLRLYFVQTWIMVSEVYFESAPLLDNITDDTLKIFLVDDEEHPIFDKQGNIILDQSFDNNSNTYYYIQYTLGIFTALLMLAAMTYFMIFILNKNKPERRTSFGRLFSGDKVREWIVKWSSAANDNPQEDVDNITQSMVKLQLRAVDPEAEISPRHQPKQSVSQITRSGYSTTLRRSRPNCDSEFTIDQASQVQTCTRNTHAQYRNSNTHEKYEQLYQPQALQVPRDRAPSTSKMHYRTASGEGSDYMESGATHEPRPLTGRYAQKSLHERIEYLVSGRHSLTPLNKIQLGPDYLWNIGSSDAAPPIYPQGELVPVPAYALTAHSTLSCYLDREIRLCTTEKLKLIVSDAPPMVQVRIAHIKQGDDCMEYFREVRLMASLSHAALCNAIGVVTSHIPPLVVLEFAPGEELCHLLRTAHKSLSFQLLIFITTQICSAMRYLESLGMVHRDLAARNCLVYPNNRIKVTDLAMYSNQYKTDYHVTPTGRKLPLRWMSWEAILLGQTTCASSVWSFGVTAWEVLQHCSAKPFAPFSDDQLIEIHEHLFYGGELHTLMKEALPMPRKCPSELYKILQRCWRQSETERPTFDELYNFILQHYHEDLPYDYLL